MRKIEKVCMYCGKTFTVFLSKGNQKCCSVRCGQLLPRPKKVYISQKIPSIPLTERERRLIQKMYDERDARPRTNCACCPLMSRKDENGQLVCGKVVNKRCASGVKVTNVPDDRCTFKWGNQ